MNIVIYINVKHLHQCLVWHNDCKKCFNFLPQVIPSTKRCSPGARKLLTLRHHKPITRQTFSNKGNITITTRETNQSRNSLVLKTSPTPGGRSGKWNALQVSKPGAVSGPTGRQHLIDLWPHRGSGSLSIKPRNVESTVNPAKPTPAGKTRVSQDRHI